MQPLEVLAALHIRQWIRDRSALRNGRTTDYRRLGFVKRRERDADARIVRVLDFERVLAMLPAKETAALLLAYGDHATRRDIAHALNCCDRSAYNVLTTARRHLADILDRLDLL